LDSSACGCVNFTNLQNDAGDRDKQEHLHLHQSPPTESSSYKAEEDDESGQPDVVKYISILHPVYTSRESGIIVIHSHYAHLICRQFRFRD